jgi:alpha-glucosidase
VWKGADHGRDGCRVPQPWEDDLPANGFTTGAPWLPVPDSYAAFAAAAQLEDTGSTLSLYRRALELRRLHPGFAGTGVEWFGAPDGCLAFRRAATTLVCALNTSSDPVPLPPGDPLLVSGPLDDGMLPPDTAVWLA